MKDKLIELRQEIEASFGDYMEIERRLAGHYLSESFVLCPASLKLKSSLFDSIAKR